MQAASVAKVEMTFSLAMRPVTAATANTQPHSPICAPKPTGVKSGCTRRPKLARMLSLMRSSDKNSSVGEKCEMTQMMMVEARMMVNAFLTKCLVLSHRWIMREEKRGAW